MREKHFDPDVTGCDAESIPVKDSELQEDDPELERDYRMLAQWLLDVYRELHEKTDSSPPDGIDF